MVLTYVKIYVYSCPYFQEKKQHVTESLVIMKKWPTLIKIGVWVTLCLFLVEYLNPSAVGVRACYAPSSRYYSSFDNNSPRLKKSNPLIWVSADYDHLLKNRSTLFDKPSIEKKSIPHAMIWDFPLPINRVFPKYKFQPVQKILSDQLPFEEIYHPPRLPFSFLSV